MTASKCARVVELADSLDSGSSAHYGRAGSSPASRTRGNRVRKGPVSLCSQETIATQELGALAPSLLGFPYCTPLSQILQENITYETRISHEISHDFWLNQTGEIAVDDVIYGGPL